MSACNAYPLSAGRGVAWNSYDPSSFGWAWAPPPVPFVHAGRAFPQGVASDDVAVVFHEALDRIVPLMSEPLDAHDDCWGYEVRDIRAQPGARSFHGYGLAIDVNATTNGQTTAAMSSSTTTLPLDTGDRVRDLLIEWGGDWSANSPRDPMHLELHGNPSEVAALAAKLRTPTPAPPVVPVPFDPHRHLIGVDMPTVIKAPGRAAAWWYGAWRTQALSSPQWTQASAMAAAGLCQIKDVTAAEYDAWPVVHVTTA